MVAPAAGSGGKAVSTMAEPKCGGAGEIGIARIRCLSHGDSRVLTVATRLLRDTRGSTAMEYALIGSLIFLVAAGSLRYYASRMNGVYTQINNAVTQSD
jgi:Flp pilus assembly pilin Flp